MRRIIIFVDADHPLRNFVATDWLSRFPENGHRLPDYVVKEVDNMWYRNVELWAETM
jgi:hypothetical protein